jgi:hypothetical protein
MATKLAVLRLVGDSLRDVFGHLGGLARIAWPYWALAAALVLAERLVVGTGGEPAQGVVTSALGAGTAGIVLSLAALPCAVRWQRHVILAEPLAGVAPLNGRVLRYFLYSALLCLISALPAAGAAMLATALGALRTNEGGATPFAITEGGIALLVAGVALGLLLFVRLSPILPAVSIDDRTTGLRRAWAATRGHGLRLFGTMLLLALGLGILGAVGGLLQALVVAVATANGSPDAGSAGVLSSLALDALVDLVSAMVAASVIARIYRALAGAAVPEDPAMAI